jgi:hypothetical protein
MVLRVFGALVLSFEQNLDKVFSILQDVQPRVQVVVVIKRAHTAADS